MTIEKIIDYDIEIYNFKKIIEELYSCKDLQLLHNSSNEKYETIFQAGKDSDTVYHKMFYDKMRSGWPQFLDCYKKFIKEVIMPIMGVDEVIYQTWPSFRVRLPGNVAVGGWHRDSDYHHPPGEINFIVAVTSMFESNTTITESEEGNMEFHQIEL